MKVEAVRIAIRTVALQLADRPVRCDPCTGRIYYEANFVDDALPGLARLDQNIFNWTLKEWRHSD